MRGQECKDRRSGEKKPLVETRRAGVLYLYTDYGIIGRCDTAVSGAKSTSSSRYCCFSVFSNGYQTASRSTCYHTNVASLLHPSSLPACLNSTPSPKYPAS